MIQFPKGAALQAVALAYVFAGAAEGATALQKADIRYLIPLIGDRSIPLGEIAQMVVKVRTDDDPGWTLPDRWEIALQALVSVDRART